MRPKNNILRILASVCLSLSLTVCFSQDYHELGKEFLLTKSGGQVQFQDSFRFSKESREKNMIVLESDDPDCFVIILKNKNNPKVIAYSTQNRFTQSTAVKAENEEPGELLKELSGIQFRNFSMKTSGYSNRIPVGPMLNTEWAQNRWFNIYCPYDIKSNAGEHDMVGCVANALGQVIRYYGKWNNFIIDKEYIFKGEVMTSSACEYEWINMLDIPVNYDLDVSRFLADLGILLEMGYGPDCSSKGFGYARKKGFANLGYDSARTSWRGQDENWLEDIYSNLERYHPVMIGGGDHAYICDGYDEKGRLHFNMGWGGLQNGFYDPSIVSSFKYFSDEAVVEAFPSGYENFSSPGAIRTEDVEGQPSIVWSCPRNAVRTLSYNVYYSDNEYFSVSDTVVALEDLKPGRHEIKVSAVYPEGESLWIGPVRVYVQGELATGLDAAIASAVTNSLSRMNESGDPGQLHAGQLEMINKLEVTEPCLNTFSLQQMPGIQDLKMNASALGAQDLKILSTLVCLQNLELSHFSGKLPDLSKLPKLVQLKFASCSLEDLAFLGDLKNLMVLEFENCHISGDQFPENLTMLVHLSFTGTGLTNTAFLNAYHDLRILKLKGCGLSSFESYSGLNRLISLDISENQLESTDFLHYLPNLKMVNASNNDFEIFSLTGRHPYLYCADFSHNRIDTIQMAFTCESLELVDLSHNDFTSLPRMGLTPELKALNLSNNRIPGFNKYGIPGLDSLNISCNRVLHLEGIEWFESITSLVIRGNLISDISPLIENNMISKLDYLDLTGNPLSKESFEIFLPNLTTAMEKLYVPEEYEPRSPCFPEVSYETTREKMRVHLSWFCENESQECNFDLYLDDGEGFVLANKAIINPYTELDIEKGKVYTWVVKSNFKDTCFYSGQYHFQGFDVGDGTFVESGINPSAGVIIYPNPADQYIRIQGLPENYGPASIGIINSSGQVVRQEVINPGNGAIRLAVDNLVNGYYFYQVSAQKQTLASGKIIIAHEGR